MARGPDGYAEPHAGDRVHLRHRDPQRTGAARRRHPGALRRGGVRPRRSAAAAARAACAHRDGGGRRGAADHARHPPDAVTALAHAAGRTPRGVRPGA
ncbi:hypothetical protein SGPA1_11497 [Streptomyces misionensis JCM 4497]